LTGSDVVDVSTWANGPISVSATVSDAAGNPATPATKSLTLDNATPTVTILRSGTGTMTGEETITFTLSEASTDFVWNSALQQGDIVVSGGTLILSGDDAVQVAVHAISATSSVLRTMSW
jgi:hypothetical protein